MGKKEDIHHVVWDCLKATIFNSISLPEKDFCFSILVIFVKLSFTKLKTSFFFLPISADISLGDCQLVLEIWCSPRIGVAHLRC